MQLLKWEIAIIYSRRLPAGRTGPERCRLLHIVVVGGGPTGVEFAGELTDFIRKDLHRIDPDRAADIKYDAACPALGSSAER